MRDGHPIRFCLTLLLSCLLWFGWETPLLTTLPEPMNFLGTRVAQAASQPPEIVNIELGTADNQLRFVPDQLTFKVGTPYKLVLKNPSDLKHYFTAKDFADASWTQKVEAGPVEIKGAIHELELKPKAVAEWFFTPMKPGQYELRCVVQGHTEAGMVGTITITS